MFIILKKEKALDTPLLTLLFNFEMSVRMKEIEKKKQKVTDNIIKKVNK